MSDRRTPANEPKQTTPKGKEIPVPKREDVFRDLRKIAKPTQDRDVQRRKPHGP